MSKNNGAVQLPAESYRLKTGKNIKPMHDWVLAELVDINTTSSGLYVGETDESQRIGIVRAVGPGRVSEYGVLVPVACQVGMAVSLAPNQVYEPGLLQTDDGKDWIMWRDRDSCFERSPS